MYILKWHGYHVVRGNKEGMAPKIPDPSYRGGIFVLVLLVFFVLIFHHYAVPWLPCVIVLMILCSVRPVNITTYWFLAGSVLLAWTTPQPTLGCPGLRLRESIAVLDVGNVLCCVFSAHSQLSNLHAMLRLMTNFEILQTSPYQEDKQSLFIKMKCQWKVIFWE